MSKRTMLGGLQTLTKGDRLHKYVNANYPVNKLQFWSPMSTYTIKDFDTTINIKDLSNTDKFQDDMEFYYGNKPVASRNYPTPRSSTWQLSRPITYKKSKMISIKTSDKSSLEISKDTKLYTVDREGNVVLKEPSFGMCIPVLGPMYTNNIFSSIDGIDLDSSELEYVAMLMGAYFKSGKLVYNGNKLVSVIVRVTKAIQQEYTFMDKLGKYITDNSGKVCFHITNKEAIKLFKQLVDKINVPHWITISQYETYRFLCGYTGKVIDGSVSIKHSNLDFLYSLSSMFYSIRYSTCIEFDGDGKYKLVATENTEHYENGLYTSPNINITDFLWLLGNIEFVLPTDMVAAIRERAYRAVINDMFTCYFTSKEMSFLLDTLKLEKKLTAGKYWRKIIELYKHNTFTAIENMELVDVNYGYSIDLQSDKLLITHNGFMI